MRLAQRGWVLRSFRLAIAVQPPLFGTIAIVTVGAQSRNDFSFSVKTQTRSAFEILVFAMPKSPKWAAYRHNLRLSVRFRTRATQSDGEALSLHRAGAPSPTTIAPSRFRSAARMAACKSILCLRLLRGPGSVAAPAFEHVKRPRCKRVQHASVEPRLFPTL